MIVMRKSSCIALCVLLLIAVGVGGFWTYRLLFPRQTIPQDPEYHAKLQQHRAQSAKAFYLDSFQKLGKRNPNWDEPALKAVRAAHQFFTTVDDPPAQLMVIFAAAKEAIEAGCDDPLIVHLYARSSYGTNYPGHTAHDDRWTAAAKAMGASDYPAELRFAAHIRASEARINNKRAGDDRKAQAREILDQAVAILPEVMAGEPSSFDRKIWYDHGRAVLKHYQVAGLTKNAAYDRLDNALAKAPSRRAQRLTHQASRHIDNAWEARGSGLANTVTQQGFTRFFQELSDARQVLEEAWRLDPNDTMIATLMIQVEVGIGESREEMEKWFDRAIRADSDNETACQLKLSWLDPKWHGSEDEMLDFARACRATNNLSSEIPLLLAVAHHNLWCLDRKHFESAAVANELIEVYEAFLKQYPANHRVRSEFASMCTLCKRYDVAHREFQLLGDNLTATQWFPKETVEFHRGTAAERVAATAKREKK